MLVSRSLTDDGAVVFEVELGFIPSVVLLELAKLAAWVCIACWRFCTGLAGND